MELGLDLKEIIGAHRTKVLFLFLIKIVDYSSWSDIASILKI